MKSNSPNGVSPMRYYLSQAEYDNDKDAPKETCLVVCDNVRGNTKPPMFAVYDEHLRYVTPMLSLHGSISANCIDSDGQYQIEAIIDLRSVRTLTPAIVRLLGWCGYEQLSSHILAYSNVNSKYPMIKLVGTAETDYKLVLQTFHV